MAFTVGKKTFPDVIPPEFFVKLTKSSLTVTKMES